MSPTKGTRKPCDVRQARQRLIDARQFLEAAELLDAPDVVATNAIHAAIAAADAITCHMLGERSSDGNHVAAVDLLRQVDANVATTLKRALDRKTQAGTRAPISALRMPLAACGGLSNFSPPQARASRGEDGRSGDPPAQRII